MKDLDNEIATLRGELDEARRALGDARSKALREASSTIREVAKSRQFSEVRQAADEMIRRIQILESDK